MQRPKPGKPVTFVRVEAGMVVWTTATLFADGSMSLHYELAASGEPVWYVSSHQPDPDNWPGAVSHLRELGFVELADATRGGLLPPGWAPPGAEPFGRCPAPPDQH